MQKRLEKVEPMYRIADWVEDWQKNAELTALITQFPSTEQSPPNSRKGKNVRNSLSAQFAAAIPSLLSYHIVGIIEDYVTPDIASLLLLLWTFK